MELCQIDLGHHRIGAYSDRAGIRTVAKHFHEHLVRGHGFEYGYSWTRLELQKAGLVKKAKQRGAYRKRRPRRPLPGMLLFQEGSLYRWLVELGRNLYLVATIDDATGEVYSALLVEQGTHSSFRGRRETITEKGLFCALYTDRAGHYFQTPKAGDKGDKKHLTEIGRAPCQLGIEHIAFYSPQARGRIERLFGTVQKSLPQELRVAGISEIEDANRYIAEIFLPPFNALFAVPATEQGSAFVAHVGHQLADILSIQEERQVQNDNTVRYKRLVLQIPEQAHRGHFVRPP